MNSSYSFLRPINLIILLWISSTLIPAKAQMVIGTSPSPPDKSATLEVSSGPYTTGSIYRGLLPPKVALVQTNDATPVTQPSTGLLVYNTASQNDVMPGYYYWQGTRWLRFETSSKENARVAAAGGQPVQMYLMSEVRSQSITASNFLLVDSDREGLFSYVSNDTTSDNGGTVLVSANGRHYCRVIEGAVNVKWFGAKGDGTTDDTQAIQTAINFVRKAADPKIHRYIPKYSGNPGTLLIPVGGFKVSNLRVDGSIRFVGQGGGAYAGSMFVQKNEGEPILLLGPDTDGTSNSTVIENIMFKSVSAVSNPNSAQIKTLEGISTNDIYIRNCWFQNSEANAIWITQGDDIQISGCTFDVLPYNAIQLGTVGGGLVTNARIINNTFYHVSIDHIKVNNAKGLIIDHNSAYNAPDSIPTATFVNTREATTAQGITINNNNTELIPTFCLLQTSANAVVINNNVAYRNGNSFLWFIGGGVARNIMVTGNSIHTNGAWTVAPISSIRCGVQNSIITGNSFTAGALSMLGLDLSDGRTANNMIRDNLFTNIMVKDNLSSPFINGQGLESSQIVIVSTEGWNIFTYNQLIAPNTLSAGSYLLTLQISKPGTDIVRAVYIIPVDQTSAAETKPKDLNSLNFSAYKGVRSAFKVRLKQPTSGTGIFGIEATVNDATLVGGTITYSLKPLL